MHAESQWKDHLLHAQTVGEVIRIMRDYLTAIAPDVWDALPSACQEALSVDDIPGSALILLREELQFRGNPSTGAMLHDLAHTFVTASNRIVAIQARG
jgi:hypothetical protein